MIVSQVFRLIHLFDHSMESRILFLRMLQGLDVSINLLPDDQQKVVMNIIEKIIILSKPKSRIVEKVPLFLDAIASLEVSWDMFNRTTKM